jgi:hypothetical protein
MIDDVPAVSRTNSLARVSAGVEVAGSSVARGPEGGFGGDHSLAIFVDAFSGFVSGVAALCVSQPFDTVRVRAQTMDFSATTLLSSATPSTSSAAARTHLYNTIVGTSHGFGFLGFYRGFFPPLMSTTVISTTVFSVFGWTKRQMCTYSNARPGRRSDWLPLPLVFLSGSVSGALTSVLTTPIHRVKVQLQTSNTVRGTNVDGTHTLKSAVECTKRIFLQEGLRKGMYKGWGAQALSETFGRGVYFGTYEGMKRWYVDSYGDEHMREFDSIPLGVRMFSGALSGIVGWTVIYPLDVIKNRMQAETVGVGAERSKYRSIFQTARDLYANYGRNVKIFYRGLSVMLVRALPVSATALPVYDLVHKRLEEDM